MGIATHRLCENPEMRAPGHERPGAIPGRGRETAPTQGGVAVDIQVSVSFEIDAGSNDDRPGGEGSSSLRQPPAERTHSRPARDSDVTGDFLGTRYGTRGTLIAETRKRGALTTGPQEVP